jgi:RnfABCDGE-type electron transport complex B subunit
LEGLNSSYERTSEIVRDSGKRVQTTDAPADAPEKKKLVYEIEEGCIGCTKCARLCPVDAISGEIKKPHVIDPEKCIGCGACADACPVKVIHTAE